MTLHDEGEVDKCTEEDRTEEISEAVAIAAKSTVCYGSQDVFVSRLVGVVVVAGANQSCVSEFSAEDGIRDAGVL